MVRITMSLTITQIEVAKKIGRAIAKDAMAGRWTGIEDKDGDILATAGIDPYENRDGWSEAIEIARIEYTRCTSAYPTTSDPPRTPPPHAGALRQARAGQDPRQRSGAGAAAMPQERIL